MNTASVTVTHKEITIDYNERTNRWHFCLRGRDRSADSLAKAKEYIDKPVPKEKEKPFEPIPVWMIPYDGDPEKGTVTGIAEPGYRNQPCVWFKDSAGSRKKEDIEYNIYDGSEANDALCAEILAKREQIKALKKECDNLRHKLTKFTIPQPSDA